MNHILNWCPANRRRRRCGRECYKLTKLANSSQNITSRISFWCRRYHTTVFLPSRNFSLVSNPNSCFAGLVSRHQRGRS
jgi:hypothetical protein